MAKCVRSALVVSFCSLVGCGYTGVASFDVSALEDAGSDATIAIDRRRDAAPDDARDAATTEVTVAQDPCSDPSLLLCVRFEDRIIDQAKNQPIQVSGAPTFAPGVDGEAVNVDPTVSIHVADPGWTYNNLSIELWLKPTSLPLPGTRAGLIDKDNAFGVFLLSNGTVSCFMADFAVAVIAKVGTWVHIACVNDGSTTRLFADGVEKASVAAGSVAHADSLVAIGGNSPSGEPLTGAIDTLRVFARARTAAEIASSARR